jgi:heme/copper-type cytochrome/quinol oxidase subunit 2
MSSVSTLPDFGRRGVLPALNQIARATLVALALALSYFQVVLLGSARPVLLVSSMLFLLAALLITLRWRWAPLLGAVFGVLVFAARFENIVADLSNPAALHLFSYIVIVVALDMVLIVTGIAATVRNLRGAEPTAPRGTWTAIAMLAALATGLMLSAAIPRQATTGVSPELLAGLPALDIPGMNFDQNVLHAAVGQTVALRLENSHSIGHSFDIDELNVHVPVAPRQSNLILFQPTAPGTYTYYCALPGHADAGMTGTLIVTE